MHPVRVLLIAPSLDIVGGQSVQADWLLTGFAQEASVSVEFLPIDPRLPGILRPLQRVKYVRTAVTTAWYFLKLLRRARRAEVLHVFAATGPSFFLHPVPALLTARLFGKKTILHLHDGRIESVLEKSQGILRWIVRFDEVVTPSGYLVHVFKKYSVRSRAIFNVVEVERFTFRERAQPRPVFLHNRALEPLYNVACTLRAFGIIQRRYPEAILRLAHDGPLRAKLEGLTAELGLRNVHFLGFVSREDTPGVLEEADVYLTSPDIDNMPASLLECFAAGLPVVATRAGGIPWMVDHERTGLLVERGDHEALAQAAFRMIEEPGLALRLAKVARGECSKYLWNAVRNSWLDLYHALASPPESR